MKLYTAPATPFGRTVEIVAYEVGLHDKMTVEHVAVMPTKANDAFQAVNPLRKIPAFVTDEGTLLTDSALITPYLAMTAGNMTLFGEGSPDRWKVWNDYMIAKGAADCLVSARYEVAVRPEPLRWGAWKDDMLGRAFAVLDYFEAAPPTNADPLTISSIGLGVLLGYADFRFADADWRARYAKLAQWVEPINARPSFQKTVPQ